MDFKSERAALTGISETIVKCGVSLYNAVKYIYSLAAEDFYNCSIKDALKVVLNNITDCDSLQALGLRINNNKCGEMNSEEYNRILSLIVFSFAVRIPALKLVKNGDDTLTEDQVHAIYEMVLSKGAENYNEIIKESYLETKYLVKKGKPIPPYSAEWYKTYIYRNIPELSAITNKNMFLIGFVDVLFTMFYSCMEEELKNVILSYV
ncbi:MAG TPA: hypothetical protein PKI60_00675 [Oscillospiraceae bacterium]|nr:hypothetical protein [Oscillospiraceae bacterium]